ncbi:hypothetical protein KTO58_19080 [Chitinophaga pendula]|uniref:ATP-grasp domain-containing protein n=1 Tax=Chitinophaga TaxID=79328 RepID=UPI000BAFD56A|nr:MULTISPECIES: hypothetical protein [Chitinophaga]ASZ11224.1 hypothetical protein CK934_09730 [Chitinophaga sp. MD30]UCJ05779.1 hypothetical protein KTO58_19080 [Chitinophaga pendula]
MKIAYICYEIQERYVVESIPDEDSRLLTFLQEKGLDITREIWTDTNVTWTSYDLVLLKSPWDYFDRIQEFYAWLKQLKDAGITMLNTYDTVKWNSDKHYLSDMITAGFPVIPSQYLEQGTQPDLAGFFDAFNTDKLIVKPCISGGAKNTIVITRDKIATQSSHVTELLQTEAFMVQPFIKEIKEGEWSLLFFNGSFSHAVLKVPKPEDFRVQHYHGGIVEARVPDTSLVAAARAFLTRFAPDSLYARVDGIVINDQFTLMELELIEPLLFLDSDPSSYERYYQALVHRCGQLQQPKQLHTIE